MWVCLVIALLVATEALIATPTRHAAMTARAAVVEVLVRVDALAAAAHDVRGRGARRARTGIRRRRARRRCGRFGFAQAADLRRGERLRGAAVDRDVVAVVAAAVARDDRAALPRIADLRFDVVLLRPLR